MVFCTVLSCFSASFGEIDTTLRGHDSRFDTTPGVGNTTWDLAKDECPAQKWADLSQRDYGVALLNDSKYGYKIKKNVLDLNLLRSVVYPRE